MQRQVERLHRNQWRKYDWLDHNALQSFSALATYIILGWQELRGATWQTLGRARTEIYEYARYLTPKSTSFRLGVSAAFIYGPAGGEGKVP